MSSRPMMASVVIATNIVTEGVMIMMMITSKLNLKYNKNRRTCKRAERLFTLLGVIVILVLSDFV